MKRSKRPYDTAKRLADMLFSAVALIALSPLLLIVGIAVLATLGSPVIFKQQRPGLDGRPFTLYKFRTMKRCSEAGAAAVASDSDRLTRLGRFLRATSLDETPEFFNVLIGDMSLVGPRPLLMEYLPHYSAEQARRHEVRPGITGWAQVNGRNTLPWEERFNLDVYYVDNRSLSLDLSILAKTIGVALSRKGVSETGQATVRPFVDVEEDSCREDRDGSV